MRISLQLRPAQRGLGLVELMVAMTLALLLTLVITIIYLGSMQTVRTQDDNALLQETGRFALEIMGRHLRTAGYVDNSPTNISVRFADVSVVPAVMGCEASGFTSSFSSWACGAASPSDAITVSYQAQPLAGDNGASLPSYSASNGTGTDCLGQNPGGSIAISRFSLGAAGLLCEGNGNPGTPMVILPGVEDMQILYGYDTDGNEGVDLYRRANDIGVAASEWEKVRYVKVCLIVASQNNVSPSAQSYYDCAGSLQSATDNKIRRTFTAVFNLRMRVTGTPDNV